MRQRIRTVGHPEEDVDVLAELFAEDIQEWPADAWLAIDDYHYAMESTASERFLDLVTNETPIQMVLTTRNRPSWATARRVLYGEIHELDRRSLAMEDHEALELLGGTSGQETHALVHRARGWPAVLGMAAETGDFQIPPDDLPDQLYDYAEELYRNASLSLREALHRLSLVPSAGIGVARLLFGERLTDVLDGCVRMGAVTRTKEDIVLHPLLERSLTRTRPRAPERPPSCRFRNYCSPDFTRRLGCCLSSDCRTLAS